MTVKPRSHACADMPAHAIIMLRQSTPLLDIR